jgi:hypothetical protein
MSYCWDDYNEGDRLSDHVGGTKEVKTFKKY